MYNFIEVISDDRNTYKDFATGESLPYWRGKALRAILAVIATLLFLDLDGNFLRAIIAAYSILLGFSFSVLFNLANQTRLKSEKSAAAKSDSDRKSKPEENESIESELRREKHQIVMAEIFHNVSYFMYVALVLVSFTLIVLICQNQGAVASGWFEANLTPRLLTVWILALEVCQYLAVFAIYFLIAESVGSFFRVIHRVNYVFRAFFT